jgi:hypothetical protein
MIDETPEWTLWVLVGLLTFHVFAGAQKPSATRGGERPKLTTSELISLVDDIISNTGGRRPHLYRRLFSRLKACASTCCGESTE